MQHEAILECAVFGVPDEKWGEKIVAAVTLKDSVDSSRFDAAGAISQINSKVGAKFQRVRAMVVLTEMPRNAAAKVLKRDLRDDFIKGKLTAANLQKSKL